MTTLIPKFDLMNGGVTPTGAVNRPINEKLSETVSVKDFGAVGDGTTNDTAAIQAAFDSGASQIIYPAGTYLQNAVTIPNTVHIISGSGIVKQRTTDTKIFTGSSIVGLVIDGLTIQGNYTYPQTSVSSNNRGIELISCQYVRIVNCNFKNIQEIAIQLTNCDYSTVANNSIYLCGRGIYFRGCRRSSIVNNIVDSTILADTVFTIGISLESTDGHAYGVNKEIVVNNNIVRNYINAQGIMAHSGTDITFSNNVVTDPMVCISVNPFNSTDICTNITISSNNVSPSVVVSPTFSYNGNDGIVCQAGGATTDITNVSIVGNTVINANRTWKNVATGGIRIGYTHDVSIVGNTIYNAAVNGIILTANEDAYVISGNVIQNLIEAADGTLNGVYCPGAPVGSIYSNTFRTINSTVGTGYAIRFNNSCSSYVGDNFYSDVESVGKGFEYTIGNGSNKTVTAAGGVDLSNISFVVFSLASPGNITTFSGVTPGKIYTFYFTNGNTTITRTNAYLNGGVNQTGTQYDVMQVIGIGNTTVAQIAPMSVNN